MIFAHCILAYWQQQLKPCKKTNRSWRTQERAGTENCCHWWCRSWHKPTHIVCIKLNRMWASLGARPKWSSRAGHLKREHQQWTVHQKPGHIHAAHFSACPAHSTYKVGISACQNNSLFLYINVVREVREEQKHAHLPASTESEERQKKENSSTLQEHCWPSQVGRCV